MPNTQQAHLAVAGVSRGLRNSIALFGLLPYRQIMRSDLKQQFRRGTAFAAP